MSRRTRDNLRTDHVPTNLIKVKKGEKNSSEKPVKIRKLREGIHGNRIKAIITEIDMCQQELADIALNSNKGLLSRIMNGKKKDINLVTAFKISNALNRPIEDIFIFNKTEE